MHGVFLQMYKAYHLVLSHRKPQRRQRGRRRHSKQNAQNVYVSIFIPNDSTVGLNCVVIT